MSCYPSAEEMIECGESSVLTFHRSFKSSLGLVMLLGVFIAAVLYCNLEFGSRFRWLALLPGTIVLQLVYRYVNDLYMVTRDQVVHQQGRVSLRYAVPSIRCIDLRAISVEQSLLGRILSFGDVNLATAAQSGAELVITGVSSPQELAKLIDDLRVHSQRATLEENSDSGSGRIGND